MNIPKEYQKDFDSFPPVLRALLDAEIAAGNALAEIGHGFPAPPAGAYIKLAKPLCSRPRASGDGIQFYDRNGSTYSGEITDAKRFFFLLEPPHPPEPEPDTNAIRAALEARQRAADAELCAAQRRATPGSREKCVEAELAPDAAQPAPPRPPQQQTTMDRFREGMVMNYEHWHDGIGYDLSPLKTATSEELVEIENLLVSRGVRDWRDVEALAALDSPRARVLLRETLKSGKRELAVAVTEHAPNLVSEAERVDTLVAALEGTEIYGGLTQTLLQVESFHPPQIVEALLRGVLKGKGESAVHFAAMLMLIHGKATTSFDWDKRPFFLKFNTDDRAERETLFRELCGKIRVSAEKYLATPPNRTSAKGHARR